MGQEEFDVDALLKSFELKWQDGSSRFRRAAAEAEVVLDIDFDSILVSDIPCPRAVPPPIPSSLPSRPPNMGRSKVQEDFLHCSEGSSLSLASEESLLEQSYRRSVLAPPLVTVSPEHWGTLAGLNLSSISTKNPSREPPCVGSAYWDAKDKYNDRDSRVSSGSEMEAGGVLCTSRSMNKTDNKDSATTIPFAATNVATSVDSVVHSKAIAAASWEDDEWERLSGGMRVSADGEAKGGNNICAPPSVLINREKVCKEMIFDGMQVAGKVADCDFWKEDERGENVFEPVQHPRPYTMVSSGTAAQPPEESDVVHETLVSGNGTPNASTEEGVEEILLKEEVSPMSLATRVELAAMEAVKLESLADTVKSVSGVEQELLKSELLESSLPVQGLQRRSLDSNDISCLNDAGSCSSSSPTLPGDRAKIGPKGDPPPNPNTPPPPLIPIQMFQDKRYDVVKFNLEGSNVTDFEGRAHFLSQQGDYCDGRNAVGEKSAESSLMLEAIKRQERVLQQMAVELCALPSRLQSWGDCGNVGDDDRGTNGGDSTGSYSMASRSRGTNRTQKRPPDKRKLGSGGPLSSFLQMPVHEDCRANAKPRTRITSEDIRSEAAVETMYRKVAPASCCSEEDVSFSDGHCLPSGESGAGASFWMEEATENSSKRCNERWRENKDGDGGTESVGNPSVDRSLPTRLQYKNQKLIGSLKEMYAPKGGPAVAPSERGHELSSMCRFLGSTHGSNSGPDKSHTSSPGGLGSEWIMMKGRKRGRKLKRFQETKCFLPERGQREHRLPLHVSVPQGIGNILEGEGAKVRNGMVQQGGSNADDKGGVVQEEKKRHLQIFNSCNSSECTDTSARRGQRTWNPSSNSRDSDDSNFSTQRVGLAKVPPLEAVSAKTGTIERGGRVWCASEFGVMASVPTPNTEHQSAVDAIPQPVEQSFFTSNSCSSTGSSHSSVPLSYGSGLQTWRMELPSTPLHLSTPSPVLPPSSSELQMIVAEHSSVTGGLTVSDLNASLSGIASSHTESCASPSPTEHDGVIQHGRDSANSSKNGVVCSGVIKNGSVGGDDSIDSTQIGGRFSSGEGSMGGSSRSSSNGPYDNGHNRTYPYARPQGTSNPELWRGEPLPMLCVGSGQGGRFAPSTEDFLEEGKGGGEVEQVSQGEGKGASPVVMSKELGVSEVQNKKLGSTLVLPKSQTSDHDHTHDLYKYLQGLNKGDVGETTATVLDQNGQQQGNVTSAHGMELQTPCPLSIMYALDSGNRGEIRGYPTALKQIRLEADGLRVMEAKHCGLRARTRGWEARERAARVLQQAWKQSPLKGLHSAEGKASHLLNAVQRRKVQCSDKGHIGFTDDTITPTFRISSAQVDFETCRTCSVTQNWCPPGQEPENVSQLDLEPVPHQGLSPGQGTGSGPRSIAGSQARLVGKDIQGLMEPSGATEVCPPLHPTVSLLSIRSSHSWSGSWSKCTSTRADQFKQLFPTSFTATRDGQRDWPMPSTSCSPLPLRWSLLQAPQQSSTGVSETQTQCTLVACSLDPSESSPPLHLAAPGHDLAQERTLRQCDFFQGEAKTHSEGAVNHGTDADKGDRVSEASEEERQEKQKRLLAVAPAIISGSKNVVYSRKPSTEDGLTRCDRCSRGDQKHIEGTTTSPLFHGQDRLSLHFPTPNPCGAVKEVLSKINGCPPFQNSFASKYSNDHENLCGGIGITNPRPEAGVEDNAILEGPIQNKAGLPQSLQMGPGDVSLRSINSNCSKAMKSHEEATHQPIYVEKIVDAGEGINMVDRPQFISPFPAAAMAVSERAMMGHAATQVRNWRRRRRATIHRLKNPHFREELAQNPLLNPL